jgi:radical SAM superfamily enzyme YgiQ (UPF0313 family)
MFNWSLRSTPAAPPRCMVDAPAFARCDRPTISPRHLLLINPFYAKDVHASFGKHVLTPTLALTSLAGATPAEWSVRYWDENLLQGAPPTDPFPQLVGISVHLTFAARAYALADWYRARGAKVILGGLHVLSCPDECEPHADALVLSDGVSVWPQVIADVEADRLQRRYHGSYLKPYRQMPSPRRELLDRRSFLTTTSLNATRGCHNRCSFCYLATDGLKMPYHVLPPEEVARQWQEDRTPYAVFTDNNLGSKHEYLRDLCRALRPLKRIWSAAVSLDVTDDPTLPYEMAMAGCTGVFVGFESLSDQNLSNAGKKTPLTADYARRVKMLHDVGIQVNASFVYGFDCDGPDVFAKTVDWVEANRLECATFHILTPYPATPLFKQMQQENRLLHTDWSKYDTAHVVFQPARMSVQELEEGYQWSYRRLFSHASILKRRPPTLGSAMAYLAMSYLYKRSNWLWPLLIRHRLTNWAWRLPVEITRMRHLKLRAELARTGPIGAVRSQSVVSASV